MKKARPKIDAALKVRIASEELRERSSVARTCSSDTRCIQTRYTLGRRQLQEQAARAFDAGIGRDAEDIRERKIEKLHARIGQLTVERDF